MASSNTFWYFAYGSNLWSKRIHENNPSAVVKTVAVLKDHKLSFGHMSQRWKGASADVVPEAGSRVVGLVWEVNRGDLPNLDKQEGVPVNIYERTEVLVEGLDGSSYTCVVYKLTEKIKEEHRAKFGDQLLPSARYKNVIIRGARENNLPADYIAHLESIPDNGYDGEVDVNIPLNLTPVSPQ